MRKLAVVVLIISLLLTGCWDMREINELGMVMAVGVDKSRDGNNYLVTLQIANTLPSDSSQQGSKGSVQAPVWIVAGEGRSLTDAVRETSRLASRNIMWAHNNVIIIGENVAREGIIPVVDFFSHLPETRLKTSIAVARGNAQDYLQTQAGTEDIAGMSLVEMFRYVSITAGGVKSNMLGLSSDIFSSDHIQPLLAGVNFHKQLLPGGDSKRIIGLSGSAVFNKDKLAGFLTPEETRGTNWILSAFSSPTKNTVVTVTDPNHGDKAVSVETKAIKNKLESDVSSSPPSFSIRITGSGRIVEEDGSTSLSINTVKSEVEELVEDQITADIRQALYKVQHDYKCDVLRFGHLLHAQHKEAWHSGLQDKWQEIFPEAQVSISVRIKIVDSGVKEVPMDIQEGSPDETEN